MRRALTTCAPPHPRPRPPPPASPLQRLLRRQGDHQLWRQRPAARGAADAERARGERRGADVLGAPPQQRLEQADPTHRRGEARGRRAGGLGGRRRCCMLVLGRARAARMLLRCVCSRARGGRRPPLRCRAFAACCVRARTQASAALPPHAPAAAHATNTPPPPPPLQLLEWYKPVRDLAAAEQLWDYWYKWTDKGCMHGPACSRVARGEPCEWGGRHDDLSLISGAVLPIWKVRERAGRRAAVPAGLPGCLPMSYARMAACVRLQARAWPLLLAAACAAPWRLTADAPPPPPLPVCPRLPACPCLPSCCTR